MKTPEKALKEWALDQIHFEHTLNVESPGVKTVITRQEFKIVCGILHQGVGMGVWRKSKYKYYQEDAAQILKWMTGFFDFRNMLLHSSQDEVEKQFLKKMFRIHEIIKLGFSGSILEVPVTPEVTDEIETAGPDGMGDGRDPVQDRQRRTPDF